MLSYRTFFAQYKGATPEEVVQAIYADAKAGTDMSFDEWWKYQAELWRAKYDKTVPAPEAPGASRKLLEILLDVGALEAADA